MLPSVSLSETSTFKQNSVSEINAALDAGIKDAIPSVNSSATIPSQQEDKSEILSEAPRDIGKGTYLKPIYFVLDNGHVFTDKLLPDPSDALTPENLLFTKEYYIRLHFNVSSFNSYNYLGA